MRNRVDYELMASLGNYMQHWRGWISQSRLAGTLGVRQATISDWENKKSLPTLGLFFAYHIAIWRERFSSSKTYTVDMILPGDIRCTVSFSVAGRKEI